MSKSTDNPINANPDNMLELSADDLHKVSGGAGDCGNYTLCDDLIVIGDRKAAAKGGTASVVVQDSFSINFSNID